MLADEAGDGLEVGAKVGFGRGSVECEERLGGEAEGVGDGQANAAVADVQREDAGWGLQGRSVYESWARPGVHFGCYTFCD